MEALDLFDQKFGELLEAVEDGRMIDILRENGQKMAIVLGEDNTYRVFGGVGKLAFDQRELRAFMLGVIGSVKEMEYVEKEVAMAMLRKEP